MGESTRFGGDLERLFFEAADVVLLDVDFAVDVAFGVFDDFACGTDLLVAMGFELLIFGDNDFEGESAGVFDLADDFFTPGACGVGVGFEGVAFGTGLSKAVASGGVADSLGDVVLVDFAFEGETAFFAEEPAVAFFFGAATFTGFGSGT